MSLAHGSGGLSEQVWQGRVHYHTQLNFSPTPRSTTPSCVETLNIPLMTQTGPIIRHGHKKVDVVCLCKKLDRLEGRGLANNGVVQRPEASGRKAAGPASPGAALAGTRPSPHLLQEPPHLLYNPEQTILTTTLIQICTNRYST